MSILVKKKQVLACTLIVALVAAVGVNWYYSNESPFIKTGETSTEQVSGNLGDSLLVGATASKEETTGEEESTEKSESSEEYFSSSKLERQRILDETVDNIKKIAESEKLDSSMKEKLQKEIEGYKSVMKEQCDCENLIKAKTNSESLVIINGEKCQVIVEKNTLNEGLILQITEIIEKNTNISSENLIILELK